MTRSTRAECWKGNRQKVAGKRRKAAKCWELPSAEASSFRLEYPKPVRAKLVRRDFKIEEKKGNRLGVAECT